jgi:hypothetical protein
MSAQRRQEPPRVLAQAGDVAREERRGRARQVVEGDGDLATAGGKGGRNAGEEGGLKEGSSLAS